TTGDGLMAVFHGDRYRDHATRCLAAARELPEAIASLSDPTVLRTHMPLRVTIGMESGMVAGTVVDATVPKDWSSFGSTVSLARRLQEACSHANRTLLVGPGAWSLTRFETPLRLLDTLRLKGFRDPVP